MNTHRSRESAEWISTTDVAVLIRSELAKQFPGVKFSVRTQSYSGGSHVNVGWTDGPSQRQVDAVVGHFCGRTFDGMDDSTHHHDTEYRGKLVHFSGSQPSCQRRESDWEGWQAKARAMIEARCKIDGDGGSARFGNTYVDNLARSMVHLADFREANPLERAFRIAVLREEG